tara:strand:+ start:114 stop:398 length:285 start_codon:yes stop_codon:yes gene_type:complete
MSKKSFTAEFKSKVAIEALKGNRTINELSTEFGVHATQINSWKKQLLTSSKEIFSLKKSKLADDNEAEKERLYSQIGRLKVEADWLKKKLGLNA